MVELGDHREDMTPPRQKPGGPHRDYQYFRLARFALDGAIDINLPDVWVKDRLPDGRWRVGSPDGRYDILVQADVLDPPHPEEGFPATPTGHAEKYIQQVTAFLSGLDEPPKVFETPVQSGRIVHAVIEFGEGDEPLFIYRFYIVRGFDIAVALVRLQLNIPLTDVEKPEVRELIQLVVNEAMALETWPGSPDGNGLDAFRDHDFDGVLTMRMPARWRCEFHEELDSWFCYDTLERVGRMWAGYQMMAPPDNKQFGDGPDEISADEIGRLRISAEAGDGIRILDRRVLESTPSRVITLLVEDDLRDNEENSEPLRGFEWHHIGINGARAVDAYCRLMVPLSKIEDPDHVAMIECVGREIQAARINVPQET